MNYFNEVLQKSGVIFKYEEESNNISQEQALVIRDIEMFLTNHDLYPNNIKEFISGLKEMCEDEKQFRKALTSSILNKTSDVDETIENKFQQDSLFRMLLNVSALQTDMLEIILDEMTAHTTDNEGNIGWVQLLLNVLRYLPQICEPEILTTKLLDILEVSTFSNQIELIHYLPEILPDNQCDVVAIELSKLLESNSEITGAIIDCLNSLNLNTEIYSTLETFILNNILYSSTAKNFPLLLDFLAANFKSDDVQVLLKIINAIDNVMSTTTGLEEDESLKLIVYKKLKSYAIFSKAIIEGFFKVITNNSELKSVDLFLLLILHSTLSGKRRKIETFIKKSIVEKNLKENAVETFFKKYVVQHILRDCLSSITEIAASLLKHQNNYLLVDFSMLLYKSVFVNKYVSFIERQNILRHLILQTSSNNPLNKSSVLLILTELLEYKDKMQEHILTLMDLLEQLESVELKDIKRIYNILSTLIFDPNAIESAAAMKNEMNMLVRKQLTSSRKITKHHGIICAIMMVKHITSILEEQESLNVDVSLNITNLSNTEIKEATNLVKLTNLSINTFPTLKATYYDEMAAMIQCSENVDKHFLAWLSESVTNEFQDSFITETVPTSMNGLSLSSQYCVNSSDEIDVLIYVNIAEMVLKSKSQENNLILFLAPSFHLLRLLHFKQHNGDLMSIDALLGCGILMPVIDTLDNLDNDQLKQVADCVFHCINWFRELISAFVTQKIKSLRKKVLARLMTLIELEEFLQKCISYVPEHTFPNSHTPNSVNAQTIATQKIENKIKRPKKRLKQQQQQQDISVATISASVSVENKTSKISKNVKECVVVFRDIDIDLVRILKYPLLSERHEENQTFLHQKQLNFVLQDFLSKLTNVLVNNNTFTSSATVINPINLITDCAKLLPHINNHLKTVITTLNKLLEATDGRHDLIEMFTEEAVDVKKGFTLIMQIFSVIFGWYGFQQTKHLNCLKECLKIIKPPSKEFVSVNKLIAEFIDILSEYTPQCLHLPSSVYLIKTMQALHDINANPEYKKKIITASGKLLSQKWYNLQGHADFGRQFNLNIELLVNAYLDGANLKTICGLVATLQEQAPKLKSKEDYLLMLASIDKSNFHILYRCMCHALLKQLKMEIQSLSNNQHLVLWKTTALILQGLMSIVKIHETKTNMVCYSKRAVSVLKIFLNSGVPVLEIMLKHKPDEVIEIFKTMQVSTRFLHYLCCQSKLTKDTSLIAFVPQFRLTLETLIYRVKAALIANNCSDAFWMGNLKNRNLHGEIISSQTTTITEVSDENSDESNNTDEESMEIDDETASEVFD